MDRNFKITIQLTDESGQVLELANILVDAVLYMQGHVRYRFCIGKTDTHGRIYVTFDALEKLRLDNQSFAIMDYNTKIQDCDSRISFVLPTLGELQQRRAAMEKWFPEELAKSGDITESNNGELRCANLDVDVNDEAKNVSLICAFTSRGMSHGRNL